MSEIVVSTAKQSIFKDSLLFLFDLAYKIRFSLPLLLFASFLGFDFQIQIVSEDDEDPNNDNNENVVGNYHNIVYNLNSGLIIEEINGSHDDEEDDQSIDNVTNDSFESASDNEDISITSSQESVNN